VRALGTSRFSPKILAVKAVTAAQLSMASDGVYSVKLDEAIEAMRLTAADMSVKYKETSLSVCSGSPYFPCSDSCIFDRVSRYAHFALAIEFVSTASADNRQDSSHSPSLVGVLFTLGVRLNISCSPSQSAESAIEMTKVTEYAADRLATQVYVDMDDSCAIVCIKACNATISWYAGIMRPASYIYFQE
jgi:Serine dehydratase alpha chain